MYFPSYHQENSPSSPSQTASHVPVCLGVWGYKNMHCIDAPTSNTRHLSRTLRGSWFPGCTGHHHAVLYLQEAYQARLMFGDALLSAVNMGQILHAVDSTEEAEKLKSKVSTSQWLVHLCNGNLSCTGLSDTDCCDETYLFLCCATQQCQSGHSLFCRLWGPCTGFLWVLMN